MHSPQTSSIVLFTDSTLAPHLNLVDAALCAARGRSDIKVVAICDSASHAPPRHAFSWARLMLATWIRRYFNGCATESATRPMREGLPGLARRYGVTLLVPPGRNINHPDFLERLQRDVKGNVAFSIYCSQMFKADLLHGFGYSVNYHNSLLPFGRGLGATGWSLYLKEYATGYTFHRMTVSLDEGPILLQAPVDSMPGWRAGDYEREKFYQASRRMDEVMDMMVRRAPGEPQGAGSRFNRSDLRRVMTVDDPSALTFDDLQTRLRAFTFLKLTVGARTAIITRVEHVTAARPRSKMAFVTADGVPAEPTRFFFLPLWLYRLCERLDILPSHFVVRPRRTRETRAAHSRRSEAVVETHCVRLIVKLWISLVVETGHAPSLQRVVTFLEEGFRDQAAACTS